MVLTDRQRSDLHAGIYDYFLSRGPDFADAAEALARVDPEACAGRDGRSNGSATSSPSKSSGGNGADAPPAESPTRSRSSAVGGAPVLEKKWTAVPRLQRRVLELERQIATNLKIHAHRGGGAGGGGVDGAASGAGMPGRERRMLPRPPATHTLQSHSAVVSSVSIHPVYTMAASGSEDGTIKLWDHESGEYLRTLRGHTNAVTCVDFSPSGAYLASSSSDLSVKVWDIREFACVRTLRGHDHTISCVRFVPPPPDASYLVKVGGGAGAAGAETAEGGSGGAVDFSFEAGAKFLATASRDHTVKFWDLETGFCDHTVSDHGDWVRCLAIRPAHAGKGKEGTGGQSADSSASSGQGGGTATGSPSLALVASSGNDRTIYVYDAHDKRAKVCELRGHDHVVESLSFLCSASSTQKSAPNRPAAVAGGTSPLDYLASGGRDRTVRLWTVSGGGSCLMVFRAHENWVRGVLIHPSGNHVLSCGDDRSIRVFDIKSQRCLRTIEDAHSHFVTSIDMHHTLPIMVSGGVDHRVKCWQLD